MKLLLIRHGETPTNTKGNIHFKNDKTKLNDTGKNQAKNLVSICKENNVQIIYSSKEIRAIETAEIISKVLNIEIVVDEKIGERDWGEWAGKKWPEVQSVLDHMNIKDRYTFIPPLGESWKQMDMRLLKFINKLKTLDFKSVAVITHEGVLRAFITLLTKSPKESSLNLHFKNASVNIFYI